LRWLTNGLPDADEANDEALVEGAAVRPQVLPGVVTASVWREVPIADRESDRSGAHRAGARVVRRMAVRGSRAVIRSAGHLSPSVRMRKLSSVSHTCLTLGHNDVEHEFTRDVLA
jgi:hypothetical protein